ncbi:MAG TPA: type II toxin-antitoxin system VapC family toxin [Saprospiraceae bacterium]|nr:type II toxin-antitoxin system VapC family toxin [Saprospiraceae bacterium]
MKYILDTDWIINLLAGRKDTEEKIQQLDPQEIVISLITVAEVYESAFNYANPEAHIQSFRQFLNNFKLLNLNLSIMKKFAEIRAHLRRRGQIISDFDILLGATALHHDLVVLTYNKRHFERIPDLKIY